MRAKLKSSGSRVQGLLQDLLFVRYEWNPNDSQSKQSTMNPTHRSQVTVRYAHGIPISFRSRDVPVKESDL